MAINEAQIEMAVLHLARLKKTRLLIAIIERDPEVVTVGVSMSGGGVSDTVNFPPDDSMHPDIVKVLDDYLRKCEEACLVSLKELGVDPDAK